MDVRGSAARSGETDRGRQGSDVRSSTTWCSLLQPGRLMAPYQNTGSPTRNRSVRSRGDHRPGGVSRDPRAARRLRLRGASSRRSVDGHGLDLDQQIAGPARVIRSRDPPVRRDDPPGGALQTDGLHRPSRPVSGLRHVPDGGCQVPRPVDDTRRLGPVHTAPALTYSAYSGDSPP